MNNKLVETLKQNVISTFRKYEDKEILAIRGKIYTGNQLADEIENETEFGISQIDDLLQLTIDLLIRKKLNNN